MYLFISNLKWIFKHTVVGGFGFDGGSENDDPA